MSKVQLMYFFSGDIKPHNNDVVENKIKKVAPAVKVAMQVINIDSSKESKLLEPSCLFYGSEFKYVP